MTIFGTPLVIADDHRFWILHALKCAEAHLVGKTSKHYMPGIAQSPSGFFQVLEIMKNDNELFGTEDLYSDNRREVGLCARRYKARKETWDVMLQEIADWSKNGTYESSEERIEFIQESLRDSRCSTYEKTMLIALLSRLIEVVEKLPE